MEFIELRGGLTVPADVLDFALKMEEAGFHLQADGDVLRVTLDSGKRPNLSAADSAFIRSRKAHLLAVAAYRPPEAIVAPEGT